MLEIKQQQLEDQRREDMDAHQIHQDHGEVQIHGEDMIHLKHHVHHQQLDGQINHLHLVQIEEGGDVPLLLHHLGEVHQEEDHGEDHLLHQVMPGDQLLLPLDGHLLLTHVPQFKIPTQDGLEEMQDGETLDPLHGHLDLQGGEFKRKK